jgi:putative DNA primase/helicase
MIVIPLHERARGQWRGILTAIGIDAKHLKKSTSCPMCGGHDRFQFFDTRGSGTWFCRGCGKGAGADLVMRVRRIDFRAAAELIEQHIGVQQIETKLIKPAVDPRPKLRKMWREALPTVPGDMVDTYLRARGVGLDQYPTCIRTASSLRYFEDDATSTFPAMLACVRDLTGKPITIHRTFLTEDGSGKAPVAKPRKVVSKHGPSPHVRLTPIASTIGLAEGVETALSAAKLFNLPVWWGLTTYGIETFEPPSEVTRLIVFADHDKNGAGQKAAYKLAARLADRLTIEVKIPEQPGTDWNDVLLGRRG